MTLAPPHGVTDPAGPPAAVATVTAVLVLRGPASALPETLDSLARQTRTPDRLVVVDPGRDEHDGNAVETVRSHRALAGAIPSVCFVTVPGATSLAGAVRSALAAAEPTTPPQPVAPGETGEPGAAGSLEPATHVWVLTSDSAAAPMTLARLLDAVRRSPSVGAAGPKLLDWTRAGALHSVGLQLTRSGRVIPSPAPGEPDQGQYDRRSDVLAVPATGMLVERALLDGLGGAERAFGDFGADVDFSWRAQQSGRRVVVVPRATLRTGAPGAPDEVVATESATRMRRQARRVALARCAWWVVPLLAAWIVLSSTLASGALLLAKRPRAAWTEFSDIGAVLTPGRVLGARWRSRGTRQVRRRDLQGLFVPSRTVLRHTTDLIHDEVAIEPGPGDLPRVPVAESGPVADEAQDLNVLGATLASRAARNPGLLVVLAMTVVSAVATRGFGGSIGERLDNGLAGGETVGVRAGAGSLWHTWLDGWHGSGLGSGAEQGPHLAVLAALSWLVAHLPLVGTPASPAGAVVTALVTLALPLATLTAYLAARVVTHSRLPRALAALAWSTTAVLATAVGSGRLGGIVAAVLLPLVAAGLVLAGRRGGSTTATAATVLAATVLGAFAPALLVLVVLAGLALVVAGRGGARLRGLAIAVGPVLLLGPWVAELVARPALLFTGPGLSVWGTAQALPWQIALLHPGGAGSYPVLLSAPLVVAGLLGLLRAGRRGAAASGLAVLALVGLGYAVVAPRLHLGVVPQGRPQAGEPITAWAGTGLLVLALALVAAALVGSEGLAVSRTRGGWQAIVRWPVAAALVGAVVVSAGWLTWRTVGDELGAWQDPRPAVAVDQAESDLGNRMLLLTPAGDGLTYQLLGREVDDVARSLPTPAADRPDGGALAAAVGSLFEQGAAPGALTPAADLSDQAVGFVGLRADATDPRIRALDATAGLSRLGEHDGVTFWRVLPGGGTTDDAVAPSRARIVTKRSEQAVPVAGAHGRIDVKSVVPKGASLVLAEPDAWVRHARVSANGHVLAPSGDHATYPLPPGPATITVDVLPGTATWRSAQGLLLLLVVFLAVPFGNRSSRRRRA